MNLGIDDLIILLLSITISLRCAIGEKIIIPSKVQRSILLMVVFLIFVLLSDLANTAGVSSFIQCSGFFLTFVLTIFCVRNEYTFEHVIILLKIAAFILSMSAILSSLGLIDMQNSNDIYNIKYGSVNRVMPGFKHASTGFVQSRGGFGINMAFILPFILNDLFSLTKNQIISCKKMKSLLSLGLLFVILLSVYATSSRSTWLMSIVIVAVYLHAYLRIKIGKKITLFFVLFTSVLVIAINFSYINQIIYDIYQMSPTGITSRMDMNVSALKLFFSRPFLGSSPEQLTAFTGLHLAVHNFFINIAVRFGLGAILSIMILFIYNFKYLTEMRQSSHPVFKEYSTCLLIGTLGMLVELSFYGGGEKQLWMYLALTCSLYKAYYHRRGVVL